MTYRYCPECVQWYETFEYDVSEAGETMCPEHDRPVVGSIQPHRHLETDVSVRKEHADEMLAAAVVQDLVDPQRVVCDMYGNEYRTPNRQRAREVTGDGSRAY